LVIALWTAQPLWQPISFFLEIVDPLGLHPEANDCEKRIEPDRNRGILPILPFLAEAPCSVLNLATAMVCAKRVASSCLSADTLRAIRFLVLGGRQLASHRKLHGCKTASTTRRVRK
jgi:hypothetical protein